eukprot:6027906-Lingulodinium_polyedra.AAC.1
MGGVLGSLVRGVSGHPVARSRCWWLRGLCGRYAGAGFFLRRALGAGPLSLPFASAGPSCAWYSAGRPAPS